jgi:hypothetical protein
VGEACSTTQTSFTRLAVTDGIAEACWHNPRAAAAFHGIAEASVPCPAWFNVTAARDGVSGDAWSCSWGCGLGRTLRSINGQNILLQQQDQRNDLDETSSNDGACHTSDARNDVETCLGG